MYMKKLAIITLCLLTGTNILSAPKSSDEFVLVIDAGHGGFDSGTISVNGTLEKDINLAIAKKLAAKWVEGIKSKGYSAF